MRRYPFLNYALWLGVLSLVVVVRWVVIPPAVDLSELSKPLLTFVIGVVGTWLLWKFVDDLSQDLAKDKSLRRERLLVHLQKKWRRYTLLALVPSSIGAAISSLLLLRSVSPTAAAFFGVMAFLATGLGVYIATPQEEVRSPEDKEILRGPRLFSFEEAHQHSKEVTAGDKLRIQVGGVYLPHDACYEHFLFVGTTGSGKTTLQRMLMESVLWPIGRGHNHRAFIFDAMNRFLPILSGMGLQGKVLVLNPFDKRSVAWDIAKDVNEPAIALPIAQILIPSEENVSQPYFRKTAQILLSAVIKALQVIKPGAWSLREVVCIMWDEERIKQVLEKVPKTRRYVTQHLKRSSTTIDNVISTGAIPLDQVELLAAAWEKSDRKISLRDWVEKGEESILHLGADEYRDGALMATTRMILHVLGKIVLRQMDNDMDEKTLHRRTWFLLDEFPSLGKLEILEQLATKGRAKGACLVLGFQDISQLVKVYSKEGAAALLANLNHCWYMRTKSAESEEWISNELGSHEILVKSQSVNKTTDDFSIGESKTREVVRLVLPSEIRNLPRAGPENGVPGFGSTPCLSEGPYRFEIPGTIFGYLRSKVDSNVIPYDERDVADQELVPLNAEELAALGIVEKQQKEEKKLRPTGDFPKSDSKPDRESSGLIRGYCEIPCTSTVAGDRIYFTESVIERSASPVRHVGTRWILAEIIAVKYYDGQPEELELKLIKCGGAGSEVVRTAAARQGGRIQRKGSHVFTERVLRAAWLDEKKREALLAARLERAVV